MGDQSHPAILSGHPRTIVQPRNVRHGGDRISDFVILPDRACLACTMIASSQPSLAWAMTRGGALMRVGRSGPAAEAPLRPPAVRFQFHANRRLTACRERACQTSSLQFFSPPPFKMLSSPTS